ncbi:MAG: ferritin-like domain-containing protein [Archangiaceae bacterium]|nr:ferritin-like domain-containing protein [Archangiaceae bacterium]
MSEQALPTEGTIERWAWDYVTATSLELKLSPPAPPATWSPAPQRWVLERPGRPPELVQRAARKKAAKPGAMKDVTKRAEVLHTFLHHELQAAELMAWALLAFPETPAAFRRGLLGICQDEVRHLGLYREHLVTLGHPFGSMPIKDWFWERVPGPSITPAHFVARMGIAFEGGNLDHGARFTGYFEAAGDPRAAAIQAQICEEEVAHAGFALHWFRTFTGGVDFEQWRAHLPEPISPSMTRGTPLNLEARRRAGYPSAFLDALAAWGTEHVER